MPDEIFELGELDGGGVRPDADASPSQPLSPARAMLGRLRDDSQFRRLIVWLMVAAIALVAVTASGLEAHRRHAVASAAASRLSIDLRVDTQPQVQDLQFGTPVARGDSSLDVKLHNLGPKPVLLVAIQYELGQPPPRVGTLVTTDVTVRPGEQMDRSFHVVLPCGPTAATAFPERPGRLTARIRTVDGRTHNVPVDLSAMEQQGGVFGACGVYAQRSSYNAESLPVPGGVRISLDLPLEGKSAPDTVVVGLSRSGVPAQVGFVTSPRLPVTVRAGSHFSVTIRPVVHSCPKPLDLGALAEVGVSIDGDDTYVDVYLPLLLAQTIGRVCARSHS